MVYRIPPPFWSGTPTPGVRKGDPVPTSQAGFSLIELLTVMAVAVILMLIVAPRIDVARYQLDAAMRKIGSSVALAGQEALGTDDGCELGLEDLQRDLAFVLQVIGQVDRRHAALTELTLNGVAAL